MKNYSQFLVVTLTLISLISCTGSKPVATVGDNKITQDDVGLRMSMMKVFNPQMNEKQATEQLIRSATLLEILKSKGMKVSDEMVNA
ncbi:MAG: SurA N-terminal domain-containing protein, partial [Pseudomonadota bacterium]